MLLSFTPHTSRLDETALVDHMTTCLLASAQNYQNGFWFFAFMAQHHSETLLAGQSRLEKWPMLTQLVAAYSVELVKRCVGEPDRATIWVVSDCHSWLKW
jgi:hypothetical protein